MSRSWSAKIAGHYEAWLNRLVLLLLLLRLLLLAVAGIVVQVLSHL